MKKVMLTMLLLLSVLCLEAQDSCAIPLMVVLSEQTQQLAPAANAKLETKLRQIATKNGMDGGAKYSNFYITADITEESKEMTSGLRPLVTVFAELTLYVGNAITGDKFASTSMRISGAGASEAKAYTAALAQVNTSDRSWHDFIVNARTKINEYYALQTPYIIRQARSLAGRREYEEAMAVLVTVPPCSNHYADVEHAMLDIYQQYVDYDCAMKLSKARAAWNASQNEEGAKLAGAYLSAIAPESSCNDAAAQLAETIRARIGDEWEFAKEQQREKVLTEREKIEAIKAIGVAMDENQRDKTVIQNLLVK